MRPTVCAQMIIAPTLAAMGSRYEGRSIELLLLTVAMQESELCYRKRQSSTGRGLWGLTDAHIDRVLNDPATRTTAVYWCSEFCYPYVSWPLYSAVEDNDAFACVMARLLISLEPKRVPRDSDVHGALEYYLRVWSPSNPKPGLWPGNWGMASLSV